MKTLGKFEILDKIGQGAMGIVYKARDPLIGRLVALKTISAGLAEDTESLERFYQEARAAGTLQHPNIVTIFELGKEDDTPFIAMEFLEGASLDKVISARLPMSLSQKLGYIVHVCRAIEYAHKRGVVHRDIKPGNVMLTNEETVKVVDFGIARLAESSRSQSGMLIGTLAYMSPQQIKGEHADATSDIWAAGAMFYELISYHPPFEGHNYGALMMNILTQDLPPLAETDATIPLDVAAVVDRMLRKEVKERFQSMEEVLIELEPCWKRLQQAEVSGLVADAQQLLKRKELQKALEAVRRALKIDAESTDARDVLEKINAEFRQTGTALPGLKSRHEFLAPAGESTASGSLETLPPDANVGQLLRQSAENKQTAPVSRRVPEAQARSAAAGASASAGSNAPAAAESFRPANVAAPAKSAALPARPTVPAERGAADAADLVESIRKTAAEPHKGPWRQPALVALAAVVVIGLAGAGMYLLKARNQVPSVAPVVNAVGVSNLGTTAAAVAGTAAPNSSPVDLSRQQELLVSRAMEAANSGKDYTQAIALLQTARDLNGPRQAEIDKYLGDYERLSRLAAASTGGSSVSTGAPPVSAGTPSNMQNVTTQTSALAPIDSAVAARNEPTPSPAAAERPAVSVLTPGPAALSPNLPAAAAPTAAASARAEEPIAPARTAAEAATAPVAASAALNSPDRQAINAAVEQLSAAFSHRSMAELQAVWPKVNGNMRNSLKTVFDTYQSVSREFHIQSMTVANDGLSGSAIGTYEGKFRLNGSESSNNGNFYVQLTKRNGKWYIDDARF